MVEKLNNYEMSNVMPWRRGYNEKPISIDDWVDVCEWCRTYHKYSPDKDTKDILYRWCIGVYQLAAIQDKEVPSSREWSEAVGSCFIHTVSSFENCDICCCTVLEHIERELVTNDVYNKKDIYEDILRLIPLITKQILYFSMGRKNRFDRTLLEIYVNKYIGLLVKYNYSNRLCLKMQDGIMLAMDKLQNIELKTH